MSLIRWTASLIGAVLAVTVLAQVRRPLSYTGYRTTAHRFGMRLLPFNRALAMTLIAKEAQAVLSTATGRAAAGVNIVFARGLWDQLQPAAIVERVRVAASELDPPHPVAARLVVRPVPADSLPRWRVLVTLLCDPRAHTRSLTADGGRVAEPHTLELIPIVDHVARFVLPPGATLILGAQGDLYVPERSAAFYGISRFHVALTNRDGALEFADLGATNGVFLNGRRATTRGVSEPGDELACGTARWLIAEYDEAAKLVPPDPNPSTAGDSKVVDQSSGARIRV